MFFLAILALKIIISTILHNTCETSYHVCHSKNFFRIPIVIPTCFALPILLIIVCLAIIVLYFFEFFFFSVVVFSTRVSLFTMGLYATISPSNSASCLYSCSLFFLPFFLCFPQLSCIFLFCLVSSACLFLTFFFQTLLCAHHWLYNMHDFVTTCGVFFLHFFISGNTTQMTIVNGIPI